VANVQVAVGLGRKAGLHVSIVLVGLNIFDNAVAQELEVRDSGRALASVSGSTFDVFIQASILGQEKA
jgi:hypothetical protein